MERPWSPSAPSSSTPNMATSASSTPHPHLHLPVLYAADIPKWVTWQHLVDVFRPCGAVTLGGKDTLPGSRGTRTRWTIRFSDMFQAEMALATLQGTSVPGVNPPFTLELSYSPTLSKPTPYNALLPQYVRYTAHEDEIHLLQQASVQDIFTWFRRAGPLVSVRVNVDVGWPHPTCIVQFWDYRHAQCARMNCQILHPALEAMPPFALRTFNPRNLYCSGLGPTSTHASMQETFGMFGQIVELEMKKMGVPNSFGFVTFSTEQQAAKAMKAMNGATLDGQVITVRLHEPSNQGYFRAPARLRQPPPPETRPNPAPDASAEQQQRREEQARTKAQEDAEQIAREETLEEEKRGEKVQREGKEQEAGRRHTRNDLRRVAAKRAREQAVREAETAWNEMVNAAVKERTIKEELASAEKAQEETARRCHEADEAIKEAERAMEAARARRAEAEKDSVDVLHVKNAVAERHQVAVTCLDAAREKERRSRELQEAAEREEEELLKGIADEEKMSQEEQRLQAELAELARKLGEMREQKEADRQQRMRWEREKAEEERRREAERLAREEQEREEREEQERRNKEEEGTRAREELLEKKRQEERRLQAYREAALQEKTRCRRRDDMLAAFFGTARIPWTKEQAVTRFQNVSSEFDSLRFCDTQPLTFESIPWPVMHSPRIVTLDDIEWSAVEEFFEAAKLVVDDASEYRDMVEKAHRRFHPDKWRARGLLLTVLEEDLRRQLEEAGNVVAQAITPLWLASKSK